ncbi:hypothetical protein DITRI_Ditri19aG0113600 [Diplodiscus trichospermus]
MVRNIPCANDSAYPKRTKVGTNLMPPKRLLLLAIFCSLATSHSVYGPIGVAFGVSSGLLIKSHGFVSWKWLHILPAMFSNKIWYISLFTIVWSIRIHRNNIVFHGKRMGTS